MDRRCIDEHEENGGHSGSTPEGLPEKCNFLDEFKVYEDVAIMINVIFQMIKRCNSAAEFNFLERQYQEEELKHRRMVILDLRPHILYFPVSCNL